MAKKKVFLHILGARPNFIKAAPVFHAMEKNNIRNEILHTGQHYDYDMSEQFFEEFSCLKSYAPDLNASRATVSSL